MLISLQLYTLCFWLKTSSRSRNDRFLFLWLLK